MPQWRTFSSDASTQPGGEPPPAPDAPPAAPRRRVLPAALALSGGMALVVALVVLALLALAPAPTPGFDAAFGAALDDPLGVLPATALDTDLSQTGSAVVTVVVVDVAGAVVRPGLHRLQPGDRVGDAIEAAGGYAPRVDLAEASRSLNLALPLEDGTKVLVPELGIDDVSPRAKSDGRIDLNRAGQGELETLPGIGPVTAAKIIEARSAERFDTVRDLRARGVVGQAVFDDIKDLVSVSS